MFRFKTQHSVIWPFEFHEEGPRIWATREIMFCFYGDSFAFFPNRPGPLMGFYPLNLLEKRSVQEYDEAYQVDKAINLGVACFAISTILFLSLVVYPPFSTSLPSPYPLVTAYMQPRPFAGHVGRHLQGIFISLLAVSKGLPLSTH